VTPPSAPVSAQQDATNNRIGWWQKLTLILQSMDVREPEMNAAQIEVVRRELCRLNERVSALEDRTD